MRMLHSFPSSKNYFNNEKFIAAGCSMHGNEQPLCAAFRRLPEKYP
jgi:hypothetical protein